MINLKVRGSQKSLKIKLVPESKKRVISPFRMSQDSQPNEPETVESDHSSGPSPKLEEKSKGFFKITKINREIKKKSEVTTMEYFYKNSDDLVQQTQLGKREKPVI